jgi:hypothetical protein
LVPAVEQGLQAGRSGSGPHMLSQWLPVTRLCGPVDLWACGPVDLWFYDAAKQRYDFEHCYIAPLCSWHNGMRFAYLESMHLKAGVMVMRTVPHANYSEYQHICASPNRPPMKPPLPRIRSKLPRPTVIRLAWGPLPLLLLQPPSFCLLGWSQSVCASAACQ